MSKDIVKISNQLVGNMGLLHLLRIIKAWLKLPTQSSNGVPYSFYSW